MGTTRLDPDCREKLPLDIDGPFPTAGCTDTNFILQVLKDQKRIPSPHPPPVCRLWGCGEEAGLAPWPCVHAWGCWRAPKPPGHWPLGHVPMPTGDAAVALSPAFPTGLGCPPAPSPWCRGNCPHWGSCCLILPPVKPVQEPLAMGTRLPIIPALSRLQLSPRAGLWGHSGGDREAGQVTVAVAICRVRGWRGAVGGRGEPQGAVGLRAERHRSGRTAAGARWTGRSWHL